MAIDTPDEEITHAAVDWFCKIHASGHGLSTSERADFDAWLKASPKHRAEYDELVTLWDSDSFAHGVASLDAGSYPVAVRSFAQARPVIAMRRWGVVICAALALWVGAWRGPDLLVAARADYVTSTGEQRAVMLPDGSKMVLNTQSAVEIDFHAGHRDVTLLQGEAYFDVQHDPAHPFRVAAGFGQTTVKGTSFSVRRAPEHDEVVLERGQVDLACLCAAQAGVTLTAGETAEVTRLGPHMTKNTDVEDRLAWREGRLSVTKTPLIAVVAQLQRYYSGHIFVFGDDLKSVEISGSYRINDVSGAVRTLAVATGAALTQLPGGVIILR